MDKNKVIELFHNEEFVKKFNSINNTEDAIELFKNNGVKMGNDNVGTEDSADDNDSELEDICNKYIKSNGTLGDDDLNQVIAGTDYVKRSMDFGKKLGELGAKAHNCCKRFAKSCKKGYNEMSLKLENSEDQNF